MKGIVCFNMYQHFIALSLNLTLIFFYVVFVRKNKKGKAEIVLIDHGLYETLPEEIRNNLGHFWKAIVLDDHQKMALYSKKLNVDDYNTFAEVLMQRPLDLKGARFSTKLTEEELKYLTQAAKSNFNKVIRTLQQLPRNMLFIIRLDDIYFSFFL